ncbi:PGAM [Seminavis robusta]|uniref:PGAM n=1 Tax=Seminavis robusta TaxID=568900 RepID=A0A9N8DRX4_9STRA|nr:PGAM [Seminavis robusta]|eukprot:Sro312_g114490.1 PGAM (493) ;mRNA; r:11469-12947
MSDRSLSSVRSLSSGRSLTKSPKIAPTKNSGAFVNSKETRYAWAMAKPRRSSSVSKQKGRPSRDHSPVRIVGTQKRDAFLTLQAKRDSLLPPTTRHEFALAATSSDDEGPPPPPPQMVDKTPSNKTVPTTRTTTTTTKAVPKETTPPKVVDNKTPPPKIRKRLVLMRHATSYMNEYIGANGITFGGPDFTDIFNDNDRKRYYQDSPLSPKGRQQAEIQSMMLDTPDSLRLLRQLELVVVSPLTRAIQTLELALLPHVPGHVPTVALPLAAERLYLVSDVGKPVSELEDQYGHVIDFQTGFDDTDTSTTNDPWWYTPSNNSTTANNNKSNNNKQQSPKQQLKQVQSQIMEEEEEWRPTGQGQRYYCAGEPLDAFEARMEQLVEWLEARPESTICLVGHYGVFEWLLRQPQEEPPEPIQFGNCEMRVVTLRDILDARRPPTPAAEQPEENEQQQQQEDEMSAVSDASFDTVETATETTFIHSTTTSLNTFLGTP